MISLHSLLLFNIICLIVISISAHRFPRHHTKISENAPIGTVLEFHKKPIIVKKPFGSGRYCSYIRYKRDPELPFEINVLNQLTGLAEIKLTDSLNAESKSKYVFEVAAKDCASDLLGPKEKIYVYVKDVNEFSPKFAKMVHNIDVLEGKLFDNILELKPTDADKSPDNSIICSFNIVTNDVPFAVTSEGILYNTKILNYSTVHNYILGIIATDCSDVNPLTSEVVEVNVNVKPICKAGWKDIDSVIDYIPGEGRKYLLPDARADTCTDDDNVCVSEKHQTVVKLHLGASLVQNSCSKNVYSVQSQRRICKASTAARDLLPSPLIAAWANGDSVVDKDGKDYYFDGKKSFQVPSSSLADHNLPLHFTFITWMRHGDWTERGQKEQIMCSADSNIMNRHHYSLFIRNCRLILLIRKEPSNSENENIFKPAEWRFTLPQVCDDKWHHYAINFDYPQIRIFVDGVLMLEESNNPEVIDDWPLRKHDKINSTQLTIGACYQGSVGQSNQFFKGYLMGMSLLLGNTENEETIRCLNSCHEQLDINLDDVSTGMTVGFNANRTEITITGKTVKDVQEQIRKVIYVNPKIEPTPGHRTIFINTDITCNGTEKTSLPEFITVLNVGLTAMPEIRVFGSLAFGTLESNLRNGIEFLDEIEILIFSASGAELAPSLKRIDSCTIETETALDLNKERIKFPADSIEKAGLKVVETRQGIVVDGIESPATYTSILKAMIYQNDEPLSVGENGRLFSVFCSEMNGKYKSAIYQMTVFIDQKDKDMGALPNLNSKPKLDLVEIQEGVEEKGIHHIYGNELTVNGDYVVRFADQKADEKSSYTMKPQSTPTSIGLVIIILVCLSFLVSMVVLGIRRIRKTRSTTEEKPEMEWDNTALNIIVNPLEDVNVAKRGEAVNGYEVCETSMDMDSSEEEYSDYNENLAESSDDDDDDATNNDATPIKVDNIEFRKPKSDLEWDNSTLTF